MLFDLKTGNSFSKFESLLILCVGNIENRHGVNDKNSYTYNIHWLVAVSTTFIGLTVHICYVSVSSFEIEKYLGFHQKS